MALITSGRSDVLYGLVAGNSSVGGSLIARTVMAPCGDRAQNGAVRQFVLGRDDQLRVP
jgi:hypothetical protein